MPVTEIHYTDDELGLADGWDNGLEPNFRELRRRYAQTAHELKTERAKSEAQARELTLIKAGIPAGPRGVAFAKLYDGELGDPAAVRAEYEALFGPLDPNATGEGGGTGTGSIGEPSTATDQRIANAGTNADQKPGVVPFEEALRAAKSPEEVKELIRNAPPEAGIRLAED